MRLIVERTAMVMRRDFDVFMIISLITISEG